MCSRLQEFRSSWWLALEPVLAPPRFAVASSSSSELALSVLPDVSTLPRTRSQIGQAAPCLSQLEVVCPYLFGPVELTSDKSFSKFSFVASGVVLTSTKPYPKLSVFCTEFEDQYCSLSLLAGRTNGKHARFARSALLNQFDLPSFARAACHILNIRSIWLRGWLIPCVAVEV